jgi:hypothetical protein
MLNNRFLIDSQDLSLRTFSTGPQLAYSKAEFSNIRAFPRYSRKNP